jgi:adenine deaminase
MSNQFQLFTSDSKNFQEKLKKICNEIPKAELHLHVEATIEKNEAIEYVRRNKNLLKQDYESIICSIYDRITDKNYYFKSKEEFMDTYFKILIILKTEKDFEELIYNYLQKASREGVKYAEIFISPQFFIKNGIKLENIISGYIKGLNKANEDFNMQSKIIVSFLRDLSEQEGFELLEELINLTCLDWKKYVIGVALDSNEEVNPPSKFYNLFKKCRKLGLKLCSHAEEGPLENIEYLIDVIKIDRIDHGFKIAKSEKLLKIVSELQIPFTFCPISNKKLELKNTVLILGENQENFLETMIKNNILFSLNSDDPAMFCAYIAENYFAACLFAKLSIEQIATIAKNSFISSFLDEENKKFYIKMVDEYIKNLQ